MPFSWTAWEALALAQREMACVCPDRPVGTNPTLGERIRLKQSRKLLPRCAQHPGPLSPASCWLPQAGRHPLAEAPIINSPCSFGPDGCAYHLPYNAPFRSATPKRRCFVSCFRPVSIPHSRRQTGPLHPASPRTGDALPEGPAPEGRRGKAASSEGPFASAPAPPMRQTQIPQR